MDQDLAWWVRIAVDGWRQRPGPRYRRLAAAVTEAVDSGLAAPGARLPAERPLAEALGLSRGTVVRCYEELVAAGVVARRVGAGTFVRGRPAWTQTPGESAASALLRRRIAEDGHAIDLSLSVPAGLEHLPDLPGLRGLRGHGLHPAGTPELRAALAEHLTHRLALPTTAEQVIVTSGAQHALTVLAAAVVSPGRAVLTGCPTYAGLAGALAGRGGRLLGVPVDPLGVEVNAVRRAAAQLPAPIIYVDSAASSPTGAVLSRARGEALLHVARRSDALLVEDLAQAGLPLDSGEVPIPLAAQDDSVIAVGSLSKMFWAGLRIGWIRAPAALHGHLLRLRSAHDLAPSAPSQLLAVQLLRAVDGAWLADLLAVLRDRRSLVVDLLARHLPAWRVTPPAAGLSVWAELPVREAETYAHLAARYGVIVAPGGTSCACGGHRHGVRLSLAASRQTLQSAVDGLAAAWQHHAEQLAASP
ncbi:DNA-binding transcriptional MocR family regulator [Kutzneria viridogrisea]|uniref:DNA-binding transcriptional MocR family regulator n=1 Tax=Kutzneria viridogrisea TaxID=47990 RepID=A0ABR6BB15_9PSEU|nr:DNA-binding transcriptional MocR family regulator [Kutzneria viridogrisea]